MCHCVFYCFHIIFAISPDRDHVVDAILSEVLPLPQVGQVGQSEHLRLPTDRQGEDLTLLTEHNRLNPEVSQLTKQDQKINPRPTYPISEYRQHRVPTAGV